MSKIFDFHVFQTCKIDGNPDGEALSGGKQNKPFGGKSNTIVLYILTNCVGAYLGSHDRAKKKSVLLGLKVHTKRC
jgi:hypothetical protein